VCADQAAGRPLVPELPYRRIEVRRAADAEMAITLDDVLRRRVPISFRRPDGGIAIAPEVAEEMRDILGWTAAETASAIERYRTGIVTERARRNEAAAAASGDVEETSRRRA
jgi:glycerol-3-phosphate dehydrogenase